jgi:hypothetical protein
MNSWIRKKVLRWLFPPTMGRSPGGALKDDRKLWGNPYVASDIATLESILAKRGGGGDPGRT